MYVCSSVRLLALWRVIPIHIIEPWSGKLSLNANQALFGSVTLENPLLHADFNRQNLQVDRLVADLLGGKLGAEFQWVPQDALSPNRLSGHVRLVDADARLLLDLLARQQGITGLASLQADIHAEGNATTRDMLSSLTGSGRLTITDGTLIGVDFPFLSRALLAASQPTEVMTAINQRLTTGRTDFSLLNLPFFVRSGLLEIDPVRFDSPAARVRGQGQFSILDQRLEALLEATFNDLNPTLPLGIKIGGTSDAPVLQTQSGQLMRYMTDRWVDEVVLPESPGESPTDSPDSVLTP